MSKKIFISISLVIFSLTFGISSILAACEDCNVSNCGDCGCVVNSSGTACVYDNYSSNLTSCGGGTIKNIPTIFPTVVSIIYNIVQVLVPILLIIFGSIDLVKGIASQKDDEIKKGQKMFIKRLIVAALVFFVFVFVKFFISLVADGNSADIMKCAECFIRNECDK